MFGEQISTIKQKNPAKEPIVLNITKKKIGKTVYTLREIQSENATETAEDKLKQLIMRHITEAGKY